MRKIVALLLVCVVLFTSCYGGTIVSNKYYPTGFSNLTPAVNSTFTIGDSSHWWDSAYIEHIYTANGTLGASNVTTPGGSIDYVAKFNSPTNIVDSHVKDNITATYVYNKLNLRDDLLTDRWLNQDTNTFVGVNVAGNDGLTHTAGSEGYGNTGVGYNALYNINTSYFNTAVGYQALNSLTNGLYNTAVGQGTLSGATVGQFNTAVGLQALNVNNGSYNTALGLFAGHTNAVGNNNVFIGAQAGKNEAGSYKLYIDSSDTATPLIGGDFLSDAVTINGVLSMSTHYIHDVVDPVLNQDAATKLYVDTHVSANSTYATSAGNADTVDLKHATDFLLLNGTQAMTGNISMGNNYINNLGDPSANTDAVNLQYYNAHLPVGGAGNVTANGTVNYVTQFATSTNITNSIMSGNTTTLNVEVIYGAELAPVIAVGNYTAGAGWTVNAGNLTRVASAVTTAYPTAAIVPTIGSRYQVTFTISGWTAGTMTVSLGGVMSTPLQGNQNVHLFYEPYTTDNLIFTPDANFAGVISAISVKQMSGGLLMENGDIYSYDSRGHLNRMGNFIRHVNEMQTDTLLDKSRSTLTCSGGVLTYTLYAVYGQETWNFNGVVYPGAVSSANVTLTGGTDLAPKTNWVYFYLNGNTPTLASSITEPTITPIIMVAEFIVGAVSGSSYTIYGYNRARSEVDSFVKRVIGRFENSGSLYVSGSLPTVNATAISVASGGKWYQGIFEMTSNNTVVAPTQFYYMFTNGTYISATSLSTLNWYSNGVALGANERQNIVWGIVPISTTASGTLPTNVKLFAVLQSEPSTKYISATTAEQDVYNATNYYPPDPQLKEVFVPIARTILRPSTPTFATFGSGLYWRDLRGNTLYGGGGATSAPDLSGYLLLDGTRAMTGSLNMGTTGNITLAAGMLVDGVDVSAHSSRQQWGGADQLNIKDLMFGLPPLYFMDWKDTNGFTSTVNGTASLVSSAPLTQSLRTGATGNSTSGLIANTGLFVANTTANYRFRYQTRSTADSFGTGGNTDIWIGLFASGTAYPTTTSNHIAIHAVETAGGASFNVYASNGDGTTETSTLLLATGMTGTKEFYIKYMLDNIKYYYSTDGGATWTLGATHTTNRPTSVYLYCGEWVKNLNAEDKRVNVYPIKLLMGDE